MTSQPEKLRNLRKVLRKIEVRHLEVVYTTALQLQV